MNILAFIAFFLAFGTSTVEKETDDNARSEATMESLIASSTYLTEEEKAMLWEINLLRTEPQSYIPFVQEEMVKLLSDSVHLSTIISQSITKTVSYVNNIEVITYDTTHQNYYENRAYAIRELLIELGSSVPMNGLVPIEPLYIAAVKHSRAQSYNNYIDHMGADGSWPTDRAKREAPYLFDANENIVRAKGNPRDIIIQLLIDSGVPSRGHRRNLLDPHWKYFNCHQVAQMDEGGVRWWVQEFAR